MEEKTYVFELVNNLEECTHCKVKAEKVDGKVRADLGDMVEDDNGNLNFKVKYGNAIIHVSEIKDFIDPFAQEGEG